MHVPYQFCGIHSVACMFVLCMVPPPLAFPTQVQNKYGYNTGLALLGMKQEAAWPVVSGDSTSRE